MRKSKALGESGGLLPSERKSEMERNKYLHYCRECAMIKSEEVYNIKNVPDRLKVIFDGVEYYPVAYQLRFNRDGTVNHTAVLHDLHANSITHAPLEKVVEREMNVENRT